MCDKLARWWRVTNPTHVTILIKLSGCSLKYTRIRSQLTHGSWAYSPARPIFCRFLAKFLKAVYIFLFTNNWIKSDQSNWNFSWKRLLLEPLYNVDFLICCFHFFNSNYLTLIMQFFFFYKTCSFYDYACRITNKVWFCDNPSRSSAHTNSL